MTPQGTENFGGRLGRFRRVWQAGLLVRDLLRLLGWALVGLSAYAVLDFFIAFEAPVLVTLDIALALVLAAAAIRWLARILKRTNRDMAERADALMASRRQTALSAYEIDAAMRRQTETEPAGLQAFLGQKSIESAAAELNRLRFSRVFPFPEIWKQVKVLLVQAAVAGLLAAANRDAAGVILARITRPAQDIPPYSRYTFAISPEKPDVLYGGTIEMAAEIQGGPVKKQVWFKTRYEGRTHASACFQESGRRFAQRLEKVVSPVEFCFTLGRARSRWYKVNLLLQPQIAVAEVTITPPAYSRLPKKQFYAGNEDVAGLKHSRVDLQVTSNRPLLDGLLSIRSEESAEGDVVVKGTNTGPNRVTFSWTLGDAGDVDVTIRDVQGTRNRDPFKFRQKIVPDKPPEAVITTPPSFSLATPATPLPLAGYAADDLGLRQVELVRTVVGYRDRIKPLGPDAPREKLDFSETLDLKALGTQPGQILEFYLEAGDLNPTLMGVTASDIARVQIISDTEYRAMLRARTTTEEFVKRYRLVDAQLTELHKSYEALKDAVETKQNAASVSNALDKARDTTRRTRELMDQLVKDYTIYDIEKKFVGIFGDFVRKLEQNGARLEKVQPTDPGLGPMVEDMLKEMAGEDKGFAMSMENLEEIAAVARVMESAARYRALVNRQSDLVRRLDRFKDKAYAKETGYLAALGRNQDEIWTDLLGLVSELRDRSGKLPKDAMALRLSAEKFADQINELGIPGLMKDAVKASENQDGPKTLQSATLALEKLQQLMEDSKKSEFGSLTQGEMKMNVKDELRSTLEQMLSAMAARIAGQGSGDGQGQGSGSGGVGMGSGGMLGGNPGDGYGSSAQSPLNIPVFGPERMSMDDLSARGGGVGGGRGAAGAGSTWKGTTVSESAKPAAGGSAVKGESAPMEAVPEKYKAAVKRYFSTEDK